MEILTTEKLIELQEQVDGTQPANQMVKLFKFIERLQKDAYKQGYQEAKAERV